MKIKRSREGKLRGDTRSSGRGGEKGKGIRGERQ